MRSSDYSLTPLETRQVLVFCFCLVVAVLTMGITCDSGSPNPDRGQKPNDCNGDGVLDRVDRDSPMELGPDAQVIFDNSNKRPVGPSQFSCDYNGDSGFGLDDLAEHLERVKNAG